MPLDYTRPIRVKRTHEKVEILRTDMRPPCPILAVITFADGTHYGSTYPRDYDSWENVPEPKRSGTVWVNVYEGGRIGYSSHYREEALARAKHWPAPLACVEVHWTEGEGLTRPPAQEEGE